MTEPAGNYRPHLRLVSDEPMTDWSTMIPSWLAWARAGGTPDTTLKLRRWHLQRLARDYPDPRALTTDKLVTWLGGQSWAAETRRSYVASIRAFFRWAVAAGHLPGDPTEGLPRMRAGQHHARPVPDDVWRVALAGAPQRVQIMILLGARMGLRRGEISRVQASDLERDAAGWTLRVHGKGDRVRWVPVPVDLVGVLRSWCAEGWFFPSPAGGHLTPAHVGKLIRRQLDGVWTTHTLRHRFATTVYAGSKDLAVVQELLGHARVETTRGYVGVSRDSLRAAVAAA